MHIGPTIKITFCASLILKRQTLLLLPSVILVDITRFREIAYTKVDAKSNSRGRKQPLIQLGFLIQI